MDISKFNTENLFNATVDLFSQLGIKLNSNTSQCLQARDILRENYKDRAPFQNITELYFPGVIDGSIFLPSFFENQTDTITALDNTAPAEGFMLFTLKLDKKPARSEISDITQAFNQRSKAMPVMVLLYYNGFISLALPERLLYCQSWRQGAKIVKTIILRDINCENPHAGHLRILQDLANHNAESFSELHEKWLYVLNVNVLNKEFYKKLLEWYQDCDKNLQIDLNAAARILGKDVKNELHPQAVIRIVIRMMFIWFMKQKDLINAEFFTKRFATEFLKSKDTYYNAILQNLFFAVLNKEIKERRFRNKNTKNYCDTEGNEYGMAQLFRYEKLFKGGKAQEFVDKTKNIPFVNGGLFTCHDQKIKKNQADNYIIDGFSDNPKHQAKLSDDVIFKLIELFDSYVWTIEESTPKEQDIALDPELLGTIFENLIGFYNPETKENARKQTGSFYTPKEIVDYMCRESFRETLKTKFPDLHKQIDDLIDNDEDQLNFPDKNKMLAAITDLHILDPACGSGAFPMGMFNLMVHTIEKLQEHKTTYKNKLDIIQNCIYGIDIQNIAVEISKLRFFISLLVDYQTPKNITDFDVLPNLETKFVVANSLIGIDLKRDESELFDFNAEFRELTKIFTPFTIAKTPSEKAEIKNAFEKKKHDIVNNPHSQLDKDSKAKIEAWNPFNVFYCSPFFDCGIMFGIADGFDIVIGNPPYVVVKNNKTYSDYQTYKCLELYSYFFEKSINLLKNNGVITFITSSLYIKGVKFEPLRKHLITNTKLLHLINEGDEIFENVKMPTSVFIAKKDKQSKWSFTDINKVFSLLKRIENNTVTISQISKIMRGLEFGRDKIKDNGEISFISGSNICKYGITKMSYIDNDTLNEFAKEKCFFENERILMRETGSTITALYSDKLLYSNRSLFSILITDKKFDAKFVLGCLNSKVLQFYYQTKFKAETELFPKIRIIQAKELPISAVSPALQQPLILLVKKNIVGKENQSADGHGATRGEN